MEYKTGPLSSGIDLTGRTLNSTLALEHALIMLLLLVGLLSIQREQQRFVPWVILAGVALSLLTPIHTMQMAWPLISALVLPPLLWQVAVRLAVVESKFTWQAGLAWLLTALLFGLALGVGAGVSPGYQPDVAGAGARHWKYRIGGLRATGLGHFISRS
jgi:cytochrome c oxidase subunit IV